MERVHFADEVELTGEMAVAALAALEEVRRRARLCAEPAAIVTYLSKAVSSRSLASSGGVVTLCKEVALDLAAGLLVAADSLHGEGRHLEAFALEGVQGRVMEAALRPR